MELSEDELEELAELWDVSVDDVESLIEAIPDSDAFEIADLPDVREYIDSLYDALEEQGWEGDISDLWDLYYGYAPGSSE